MKDEEIRKIDREFRPLLVYADGTQIAEKLRVRAYGRANMTLLPDIYVVDIYNLPDEELAVLNSASSLKVNHEIEGTLCYGELEDVFIHQEEANIVTTAVLLDGKAFSNAKVSMTIGAGATVSGTMSTIVGSAMGAFLATDTRLICAQTFSGRTADYVSTLAKAVNARAFFTRGAVHVAAKGRTELPMTLNEEDVLDEPSFAEGVCIVRTKMKSFAVGTIVTYKGTPYRLVMCACDVDSNDGTWRMELNMVNEDDLSTYGMEGG